MADKISGKQMYLTISGTAINITGVTPTVSPKFADTTDSDDFHSGTDLIYPSQIQVSAPVEMSVKGRYNKVKTGPAIIAKMFTGGGPYAVTFGVATGYAHFSGNYDISDFQIDGEVEGEVNYSCTIKSNGVITP